MIGHTGAECNVCVVRVPRVRKSPTKRNRDDIIIYNNILIRPALTDACSLNGRRLLWLNRKEITERTFENEMSNVILCGDHRQSLDVGTNECAETKCRGIPPRNGRWWTVV